MKRKNVNMFQRPLIFLLLLCFLGSASTCDKDIKHEEFVVFMIGEYAGTESAIVKLDNQVLGTLTASNPITKKITAGSHDLEIVTQNIPSIIKTSILKTDDKDFIYNVNCDAAKVFVKVHEDYALLENTALFEHGHLFGTSLTPGLEIEIKNVVPVSGAFFKFIDKNGKTRFTINKTLVYAEEWHVTVPY